MKKHNLKNGYIMVKEIVRSEQEAIDSNGFYIPKSTLDDEQVSQGAVVESNSEEYPIGSELLFHKVLPVDFNIKREGDAELTPYFFIKSTDVIDVLT